MILLNFAHPLTEAQLASVVEMAGQSIDRLIMVSAQFDHQQPFEPQLDTLMEHIDLSPDEWQTAAILVNPPSLNFIAALLLAELHGRMGYFSPVLRLRPAEGSVPPRYEVAEILNLQALRDAARLKREPQGRTEG